MVPVGALHEPDRGGNGPARERGGGEDALQRVVGVAQIGLHDHTHRRALTELVAGEHLLERQQQRLAAVEVLRVEVDVGAELVREAQEGSEATPRVLGASLRGQGPQQRGQRRELDREAGPRQGPVRVGVQQGLLGPPTGHVGEDAKGPRAAIEVGLRLRLRDRRLSQEVERERLASPPHHPEVPGGVAHVAAGDELPGQKRCRRTARGPVCGQQRARGPAGTKWPQG
jgi:hypothetical protein